MKKRLWEQVKGFRQGIQEEDSMGWCSILAIGGLLFLAGLLMLHSFFQEMPL